MSGEIEKAYFKELNRKEYIEVANRIIKEEGVAAISIRRLAREIGCSSANMYRHFENLNELIYYTQLDVLNEYIMELSIASETWIDQWEIHFKVWECYSRAAFSNPEAFNHIFYMNFNKDSSEALKEYYEMFPEAIIKVSPMIQEMLRTADYYKRDYLMCQQLVEQKEIASKDAEKLNHIICNLFLGYFKYRQEYGDDIESGEVLVQQFIEEAREIGNFYRIKNK